jgi:hypothetical protein
MRFISVNSNLIIYEYDNFKSLYVKTQTINLDTTGNIINVHQMENCYMLAIVLGIFNFFNPVKINTKILIIIAHVRVVIFN